MGEEPTQGYTYDRQVELSEAYRQKMEQLEQQGAFRSSAAPTRMRKIADLAAKVVVFSMMVALIIAVAAMCVSALP